jgi:hypothetical protein
MGDAEHRAPAREVREFVTGNAASTWWRHNSKGGLRGGYAVLVGGALQVVSKRVFFTKKPVSFAGDS